DRSYRRHHRQRHSRRATASTTGRIGAGWPGGTEKGGRGLREDQQRVFRRICFTFRSNLLSNAVKFTPEGGRISLAATVTEGVITITVSDTGIGIAPEDQASIFEEFRQVGGDDARKQEGTGLGLTLAKKFVELHGGRIWVKSQVGQGSTFTFTLPVQPDGESASDQR